MLILEYVVSVESPVAILDYLPKHLVTTLQIVIAAITAFLIFKSRETNKHWQLTLVAALLSLSIPVIQLINPPFKGSLTKQDLERTFDERGISPPKTVDEVIKALGKNPTQISENILEKVKQATMDLENGRITEAESVYAALITLWPNADQLRFNLALCYYHDKRFWDAAREFREVTKLNPLNALAHNNLGVMLYTLGELPESAGELQKALQISPKYTSARNNLGLTLQRMGKYLDAAKQFRRAIANGDSSAILHHNLGYLYLIWQKYDMAVTESQKAIGIDSSRAETYNNLGLALARLKRFDEADTVLRKALEINPDLAEARYLLGFCLYNNQKRALAKTELEKARELLVRRGNEKLVKEIDELLKNGNFN